MNLEKINALLDERYRGWLKIAVDNLEAGIAIGEIQNQKFNDAKDTINRAVEKSAEAFLATGPASTDGHPLSIWWHATYAADAFVRGAHGLPSALKRAQKAGLKEYADFIEKLLLPLADLLATAKPLIFKRGDRPKTVTPAQAAKLAKAMTCQCCARPIFAETGRIAHHGDQRPGGGWQTASCGGALELPFEVSRDRLGDLIDSLKTWKAGAVEALAKVVAEKKSIAIEITDYTAKRDPRTGHRPTISVEVTRKTFDAQAKAHAKNFHSNGIHYDFDRVKENEVSRREREIANVETEIKHQQARFDGWKKTHDWDADAKKWQKVTP